MGLLLQDLDSMIKTTMAIEREVDDEVLRVIFFFEMFHYDYALFLMTNNFEFNSEILVSMFESSITRMEMQSGKDKE